MKILSFGEILWDCYPDKKYIGGAPLNFAAHCAKHGSEVYMLSALGCDDLGFAAREYLEKHNIFTDYVTFSASKPTGSCVVTLDEHSVPDYNLTNDVAYDCIPCDTVLNSFDVLYFGTLALRNEFNRDSLQKLLQTNTFREIFADINIRPPYYSKETVGFAVKNATILKISLEELPIAADSMNIAYTDDFRAFAKILSKQYKNLKTILITLGSDGSYGLDCVNNEDYTARPKIIEAVSTVGAGDSFSAAFLSKYLSTKNLRLSMEYANQIAGFVVSRFEAVPDYNVEDFATN